MLNRSVIKSMKQKHEHSKNPYIRIRLAYACVKNWLCCKKICTRDRVSLTVSMLKRLSNLRETDAVLYVCLPRLSMAGIFNLSLFCVNVHSQPQVDDACSIICIAVRKERKSDIFTKNKFDSILFDAIPASICMRARCLY